MRTIQPEGSPIVRGMLLRSFAGPVNAAPFAGATTPTRPNLLIQESLLAGFQYNAGESVWRELREGDALRLVLKPQNPYDPRAVRVDWRGRKLGYVPRLENTAISQMLDRGQHLTARVARLRATSDSWERVRITVECDV